MFIRTTPLLAFLLLPACAAATAEPPASSAPPPTADAGPCANEGLDAFIGQKATAGTGAQLLARSGARTLRWGPPRSPMTMDFRPDRLTVSYDDDMVITSARCG